MLKIQKWRNLKKNGKNVENRKLEIRKKNFRKKFEIWKIKKIKKFGKGQSIFGTSPSGGTVIPLAGETPLKRLY